MASIVLSVLTFGTNEPIRDRFSIAGAVGHGERHASLAVVKRARWNHHEERGALSFPRRDRQRIFWGEDLAACKAIHRNRVRARLEGPIRDLHSHLIRDGTVALDYVWLAKPTKHGNVSWCFRRERD